MRKVMFVVALTFLLAGCAATLHKAIAPNRESLKKLNIGMTKDEVLGVMGTKAFVSGGFVQILGFGQEPEKTLVINNPYRSEILALNDKKLEVIYYVTDVKKDDGAISDDELTPLVFEDGKLIGWGQVFLKEICQGPSRPGTQ
jgi:hypothetical protein